MIRCLLLLVASILLGGCIVPGQKFDRAVKFPQDAVQLELVQQQLTPALLAGLNSTTTQVHDNPLLQQQLRDYQYRIGPRDVLIFTVWDHPELTIPAGEFREAEIQGHLVSPEGEIFFPYVGAVSVAGKTLVEVRALLTERLGSYIKSPQLDVRIAGFRSKRVNVVGQVEQPGVFPITDVPMTLVEAIGLAGGASEMGATQDVQVLRDGKTMHFNLLSLLQDGDLRHNLLLRDGDIVFVPHSRSFVAHVMGSVSEPGVVAVADGRLDLAEAINRSGGLDVSSANAGRIFVFRNRPEGAIAFWLDARSPDAMLLATQFELQPRDVVFVATAPAVRWNRMINLILPTIQSLWQTQSLIDSLND